MSKAVGDAIVTIISVLIGGGITFLTSWFFARRAEKDRQLAVAYSLVFKVQKYADDLVKLHVHVEAAREAAKQSGITGPAWATYSDIIGFSGSIESICAEELALVAKTKDSELVMDIRELESAHSISLNAISKIQEMRTELGKSDLIQGVQGQVVSFAATPEQFAKVAPLIINLDSLANSTFGSLPRMVEQSKKTATKIGSHLKNYYGFKHFIEMTFADQLEQERDTARGAS